MLCAYATRPPSVNMFERTFMCNFHDITHGSEGVLGVQPVTHDRSALVAGNSCGSSDTSASHFAKTTTAMGSDEARR